jgi:hypothetical protein
VSRFRKGWRCDWCGKIANNLDGFYTRPDGGGGRILSPEWELNAFHERPWIAQTRSGKDICEECAEKRCASCGSEEIDIQPPNRGCRQFRCRNCGVGWESDFGDPERAVEIRPDRTRVQPGGNACV